jgi:hypothetical protein
MSIWFNPHQTIPQLKSMSANTMIDYIGIEVTEGKTSLKQQCPWITGQCRYMEFFMVALCCVS